MFARHESFGEKTWCPRAAVESGSFCQRGDCFMRLAQLKQDVPDQFERLEVDGSLGGLPQERQSIGEVATIQGVAALLVETVYESS